MSTRRRRASHAVAAGASALLVAGCLADVSPAQPDRAAVVRSTTTTPALEPEDGALRARVVGRAAVPVPDAPATDGAAATVDHVLLVGDSVLVLVADDLARRLAATLHFDAADCRTLARPIDGPCGGVPDGAPVASGIDAVAGRLAELAAAGTVPDALVLVLANNSSLTSDALDAAMSAAATVPVVWWVNARIDGFGRQDANNRLLEDLSARDPRAAVVDWSAASAGRDWLVDHVHPGDAGQRRMGELIADAVGCGCRP